MTVENTPENAERCACPACPTYDQCMRDASELLFCAREESGCAPKAVGCSCGSCTVWRNNALTSMYFCLHGAA
jgi:hypothetical protein